jgi:DnaJ family protein C protein 11
VYDLFGEEGLRTSWELGPRAKTPEEVCELHFYFSRGLTGIQMRAQFQRQANDKKQMEVEALVKPKVRGCSRTWSSLIA